MEVIDVLEHYGVYYETSRNPSQILILCPFHDDQNLGSAGFNIDKGVFHCFSCDAGGNIYQFVAEMEGCSIKEAERLLDNEFQITVSYDLSKSKQKIKRLFEREKANKLRNHLILIDKTINKILSEIVLLKDEKLKRDWIAVSTWFMFTKNNYQKSKDILDVYSVFVKELNT